MRAEGESKCVCGRRFAPDHAGGAYSTPQTCYVDLTEGKGVGEGREGKQWGKEGKKGRGKVKPPSKNSAYGLGSIVSRYFTNYFTVALLLPIANTMSAVV